MMTYIKRFGFFFLTNIFIVITISVILSMLGLGRVSPGNLPGLAAFCFIWGTVGSLISLLMSRMMAKWMLGVKVISPETAGELSWLVQEVHSISRRAGLSTMPEVGVYESPEVNAFATGPMKSRSLVAFSSGILSTMSRDELDGVIAHEISHITNGDMVTMALLQGVINAFVMFLARVIAFAITNFGGRSSDREESSSFFGGGLAYYIIVPVLEIIFSLLGSFVVAYFSRWREFRADAGSARIVGAPKMISALKKLKSLQEFAEIDKRAPALATMKINGGVTWMHLRASHPPLDQRILALTMLR